MTSTGASDPTPRHGHGQATRTAWLLFAPPFVVVALRMWTRAQAEQDAGAWQPLRAAADSAAKPGSLLWQASQPFVFTLLALVLLALIGWALLRRFGWRRLRPLAAGAWVAVWTLAAAALLAQHANRFARQPLPAQTATVLQARAQAPTERGPGGAEALLRVPGFAAPQSVLLEDASVAQLPAGTRVQLALARGRLAGHYVTGWRLAPHN